MQKFADIEAIAISRHGEEKIAMLQNRDRKAAAKQPRSLQGYPPPLTAKELSAIADDRWLSTATKQVFCAGFNWKVIEAKWDGFEAAFEGFDIARWVFSTDDDLSRLVSDARIVRNGAKIRSVAENARFFADLAKDAGSVGKFIADWPASDHIGLLEFLKKRGSRLGGATGQYFLRVMGKDSFVLSSSVIAAMVRAGAIEGEPTSKSALKATQEAFNTWSDESGLGLTAISRTLAHSIDA